MSASVFLCGDDYLALPRDPQRWIIQDLIPVGGLVNMFGQPKAGKSYAGLGMAHAISTDTPEWLNFPVMKHGPVAYLQIDTPREEWADRIFRMQARKMSMKNVFTCDMLMGPYPFNIFEQQAWLKEQLSIHKPIVVFIDTLREAHGSDENDSTAMRNVVTTLVSACRPASMVLLSHARKDTSFTKEGGDNLMADARGSSYVAGRMDVVIKMSGNRKHATGMSYQGRSAGSGRIAISQDSDGLIVLDGADAAYQQLLKDTVTSMRREDPDASINAMATALSHLTDHRQLRMMQTHVKAYVDSLQ